MDRSQIHLNSMENASTKLNLQKECLIYEVKCALCEVIYIGNTQQTPKKRMGDNLSSDYISYLYEEHFNFTM